MGILVKRMPKKGTRKCARCGKYFIPKSSDDIWGVKCARKMHGQLTTLDDIDDTGHTVIV
jgi:hypothetical protein